MRTFEILFRSGRHSIWILLLGVCPVFGVEASPVSAWSASIDRAIQSLATSRVTPKNCVSRLEGFTSLFESIRPKSSREHSLVRDRLWRLQNTLHAQIPEGVDAACVSAMRRTFNQLRLTVDYLSEMIVDVPPADPEKIDFQLQTPPMKGDSRSYVDLRTNADDRRFEEGDVLVTRGFSFLSAIVARLGEVPTQFSHAVFLHVDPKTQAISTIESYVGKGVGTYSIDFALKNENVRILHLRAKDRTLAAKAASFMDERARDPARPIAYDYRLDFKDSATMSCAEVTQYAFSVASDKKFEIPYYPSRVRADPRFLERLGMPAGETYAPGDLEIDPRFELIGEFRDLRLTRDSRMKDAILTAMLGWMDRYHYELKDSMRTKGVAVLWVVRKTPIWSRVQRIFKLPEFSPEVPLGMLKAMDLVKEVGSNLLAELAARDRENEKRTGSPMTYAEMVDALEEIRVEDLAVYQQGRVWNTSKFHGSFHASE